MKRILFVCLGNICRSPMAEFVMKELVRREGLSGDFAIASAATSAEEAGRPVHPGTRERLRREGISCGGKTAVQLQRADYDRYDHIIGMDRDNLAQMRRCFGGDPEGKLCLLLDFTSRGGDIADPWYTGNFDETYRDVLEGCKALLAALQQA